MRRVRVDEARVGVLAAAFGVAAAWSPASPTGTAAADAIVLTLTVAVAVWLAASAPWWALALAGGVAALSGFGPVAIVLGGAGAAIGFAIGATQADLSLRRAASAGCTLVALCHLQLTGFFGASALVGLGCVAVLLGTGLARRKQSIRRLATRTAAALAIVAGVATLGAGVALLSARSDLIEGREFFESGVDHLRAGETIAASEDFGRAADAFAAAETSMRRPWAQPGRLVPIVGQHRQAGAVAASAGRRASTDIADLSTVLDIEVLRPRAGRFDLDAIELLAAPMQTAQQTLRSIGNDLDAVQSPWLVAPVQEQITAADDEFDSNIGTFDSLAAAVVRLPTLLGADGPRRYFVAFVTPAEARGQGGFMGNFAVLSADDGLVSLSDFGRTLDLNRGFDGRTVSAPDDWLRRWGRYGFTNGPDGGTTSEPWSNITISPHFPSTASAISSLYPQSGGNVVDGVIAIDPYVLQAFVGFTGPITVVQTDPNAQELTQQLTANNTAQFLLFDQYLIDTEQRVDALEQVATETMNELLDGALPDPAVLADQLGPLVAEERLVAWMLDPADQELIEQIEMSGALPPLTGRDDGLSIVVNNAGANKLDAYLRRDVAYDAVYDGMQVEAELAVTLTNSAPTSGLPDGVIGNYVGDDIGSNRSLITLYTAAQVTEVTVDGAPVATEIGREAGWNLTTLSVVIPAGDSIEIVATIAGSLDDNDGVSRSATSGAATSGAGGARLSGLVVRTQPLVDTPSYRITATDADRRPLVEHLADVPGTVRWLFE